MTKELEEAELLKIARRVVGIFGEYHLKVEVPRRAYDDLGHYEERVAKWLAGKLGEE